MNGRDPLVWPFFETISDEAYKYVAELKATHAQLQEERELRRAAMDRVEDLEAALREVLPWAEECLFVGGGSAEDRPRFEQIKALAEEQQ